MPLFKAQAQNSDGNVGLSEDIWLDDGQVMMPSSEQSADQDPLLATVSGGWDCQDYLLSPVFKCHASLTINSCGVISCQEGVNKQADPSGRDPSGRDPSGLMVRLAWQLKQDVSALENPPACEKPILDDMCQQRALLWCR